MTADAPSLRTLRLIIEYDGTDFAGWQRQTGQRTVQQCLEEAFAIMTGGPVCVRGAGRTDAGGTPTARSPVWSWPRASPH